MQRHAFERSVSDGFRTTKVESIVSTLQGRRLFVGTSDGFLTLYECRQDHTVSGKSYSCYVLESIRKQSKEKKPSTQLQNVESWRVIIGIIDGMIMAYDSQFYQLLSQIPDSKGCHIYSINEKQSCIVVANKKKLTQYVWQAPGFQVRKEVNLADTPKSLLYVGNLVIVGYKRFYEVLDINTGGTAKVVDIDKEHKNVSIEIPQSMFRKASVLLSLGTQGIIVGLDNLMIGFPNVTLSGSEERIEWPSAPTAIQILNPYLISLLQDSSVDIHELATLSSIQRIQISSTPHGLSIAACIEDNQKIIGAQTSSFVHHVYLCNGEQLSVLRMVPLVNQVESLLSAGMYEEAINLCTACSNKELLVGIDLTRLFESSANTLMGKGDFEKAVQRFIMAKTDFVDVARLFPDLIPVPLHANFEIVQTRKLAGAVLNRAAAAVVQLCDFHRAKISKRADKAEKSKESGIIGSSPTKSTINRGGFMQAPAPVNDEEDEDDYIADPDEEIRKAQLLDTMYLYALMNCATIRRPAVVDLLSSPNRCQIESCSVLLASHGNAYTEPLLWLYRSQHQHSRVLQVLTEDKCVAIGAWTKDQFYTWTADYLRWLWYHDEDASLPRQALTALKPVLEYDAELGLSVLVCRPPQKTSFGGKGVTISEVLNFLRSTSPKINYSRSSLSYGAANNVNAALNKLKERNSIWQNEKGIATVIASTPLVNGHALAVAFLECLVSSGEAPPNMHDEFAQLLVDGLPAEADIIQIGIDHNKNDIELKQDDTETLMLYKIYRRKLQNFFGNSQEYHPARILKFLPRQYLHENALVLAKLGKHREVLTIYMRQLRNQELAEAYCDKIFSIMTGGPSASQQKPNSAKNSTTSRGSNNANPSNLTSSGEIYIILFQVILDDDEDDDDQERKLVSIDSKLSQVVDLAEKHFARFDTNAFLELLPRKGTTVNRLLKYFQLVLEYQNSRKRNLQVIHQLLRTKDVNIRTAGMDLSKPDESNANNRKSGSLSSNK